MTNPMLPNQIWDKFKEHWTGTDSELLEAIENFYDDIRSTMLMALGSVRVEQGIPIVHEVIDEIDDYMGNHYMM